MRTSQNIVPLLANQRQAAASTLYRAFQDDVMYTTVFPDAAERQRAERRLWRAVIRYCRMFGRVDTTPSVEGVACWLPPGETRVTFWRMVLAGMGLVTTTMALTADDRKRFMAVLQYADKQHHLAIGDAPHWYLWALGVAPAHQGQGIGGALLQPVLAQADRDGMPCYLETQLESNAAFYQRRGFCIGDHGQVPGLDIDIWIMTRDPQ